MADRNNCKAQNNKNSFAMANFIRFTKAAPLPMLLLIQFLGGRFMQTRPGLKDADPQVRWVRFRSVQARMSEKLFALDRQSPRVVSPLQVGAESGALVSECCLRIRLRLIPLILRRSVR